MRFRRLIVPHERRLARTWQERAEDFKDDAVLEELKRFEEQVRCTAEEGRVLVARAADSKGEHFWAGLKIDKLLRDHAWITGATGSGKTYFILSLLIQVLRSHPQIPLTIVDLKGELTSIVIDTVLPALSTVRESLASELRIVRPFDDTYLPMLRVTEPEPNIPKEVQSFNLSANLAEALAEDLGARMNRVFLRMTTLAIELNEPLTVVKDWLEDPKAFAAAGRRSGDKALRAYATEHFKRESKSAIQSLLARLDTFLIMGTTRAALSAPSCVSFNEGLDSGVTILDLGDPPAGAESVTNFWAGILIGRLTRAIMSRRVRDDTPQAWVIFEEFQEALQRHQARQFSRMLALARFKKVSLWFCNQQAAQLSSVDPALVKLLQTNAGLMATFRCNIDDARTFAHALPLPDAKKDSEYRNELVQGMTRLQRREFYLWLKEEPYRAQSVRSPRLDLEPFQSRADGISDELRERLRRGIVAMRPEDVSPEEAEPEAIPEPHELTEQQPDPISELEQFLIPDDDENDVGLG